MSNRTWRKWALSLGGRLAAWGGAGKDDPAFNGDQEFARIYALCKPYTMTSIERMYALYAACRYAVEAGIPGAFVECGVWKGGSSMLIAHVLRSLGSTDRDIHMYDTYEGMPEPGSLDRNFAGEEASRTFIEHARGQDGSTWCNSPLEEVRGNMMSTGYPMERVHLVKGKVEETLPGQAPTGTIALLRLDTDWYSSTRHELVHLYPMLAEKGVLVIDDFGHWEGARRAVVEYFEEEGVRMLLNRVDYTGRVGIKTSPAVAAG